MVQPRQITDFKHDVDAVCAVDALCDRIPWSRETFLGELESVLGWYRVAELNGAIVGYLGVTMIQDEAHVVTLGVHPDCRRKGIGEELFVRFLRLALKRGVRRVTLEVRDGNLPAKSLYWKYGFTPVSRRKDYYELPGGGYEDAVVMWIDDLTRPGIRARLQSGS